MDLESRKSCLSQIDLFQSFTDEELTHFAANVKEIKFSSGEKIFSESDPGNSMYILLEGTINIFKDNRLITSLHPVDYLGEMSLIEKKPRSATATAVTPVHLLEISSQLFEKYLSKQPLSMVAMMQTLSSRIRSDTELIAKEFQNANILIHDMRNRLSSFLLLDLIKDENISDETKRYLNILKKSGRDLSVMMNEAMSNAKRLKFLQSPKQESINNLLLELNTSEFILHKSLKDKNVHLNLSPEIKKPFFIAVDIRRVISNLAINAGEASDPNGEIHITTLDKSNSMEVLVKDYGCGVSADIQSKIFKPNFTTKSYGNGLGLASCKDIIENKHQGKLAFETSQEGTTFYFSLPLE